MSAYSTYSDEHLVRLLNEDDENAFREIYGRYYKPLSQYAYNFAQNREEALDIVQDIFVSLWKLRGQLAIKHSLKAYLYQSLRNGCARLAQNQLKNKNFLEHFAQHIQSSAGHSPAVLLEHAETEKQVAAAVSAMTPVMQKVYLLSREEQMSHRDIAATMNMAENTAKKHIQNALKLIRTQLGTAPGIAWLLFLQQF